MLLAAMNNADSNNHNYNLEDNNNEGFLRDDEFDSANTKSGSENQGGSGNDQDPHHPNKKKRYHRHTQLQIQEMEAYVKTSIISLFFDKLNLLIFVYLFILVVK